MLKVITQAKTRSKPLLAALSLTILTALPGAAAAVSDAPNDFIPTYVGPKNGDLDVLSTNVTLIGNNLDFTATLNGPVGETANARYVWGINRGKGIAAFSNINEPNVIFDSAFAVAASGPGLVVDVLTGTMTTVGAATVSGNTISDVVPLSDFPSEGFSPNEYQYNLWPELTPDLADNSNIPDFAPNNANALISVAPEPGALSLLGMASLGALAAIRRRRNK